MNYLTQLVLEVSFIVLFDVKRSVEEQMIIRLAQTGMPSNSQIVKM